MNERRQDVRQPSRSNSNQSASSSPTSLDTVVFAAPTTATVPPAADSERRARSLPSSTSNSSAKSVSADYSSSSLNGSSTHSSSTTTTNTLSSYDSSSYSSTENTTSSSSYSSYSSSTSTSPRDPAVKSAVMSSERGSPIRLKPAEGALSAPLGKGEKEDEEALVVAVENDPLLPPSPVKVERSEGSGELPTHPCDCRCYCSWQSVAPEPVVLVACGSFNPITTMHLRMMELARDAVEKTWSFQQQHHQQKLPQTDDGEGLRKEKGNSLPSQHLLKPRRQVVVVGILSPVSDAYAKEGLASAASRCRLARLACATTSDWLAVDSWEASRTQWTPTRYVLERIQARMHRIFQHQDGVEGGESVAAAGTEAATFDPNDFEDPRLGEISGLQGEDDKTAKTMHSGSATNAWLAAHLRAVRDAEAAEEAQPSGRCCCGRRRSPASASAPPALLPVRVKLVCGADLLESFNTPNLWSEDDYRVTTVELMLQMTALVRDYGIVCISRPGSNAARLLYEMDLLSRYEQNVILATEWCQNGLSATLVRRALARGQSVRYLVPDAALEEIYAHGLYGAARPPRSRPRPSPRLLILVPPPPVIPSLSPPQVKEEEEEEEALHRRPQHPSTCTADKTWSLFFEHVHIVEVILKQLAIVMRDLILHPLAKIRAMVYKLRPNYMRLINIGKYSDL
uniref:Cytidyltransferase-like domain-containing protein n=1 Tax=Echinococcus canadensis TaxID=519352 RepID=A0A915EY28_9CEST